MKRTVPNFLHRRASLGLIALTLLMPASALAQQTASGVVYEDTNRNGVRDRGEPTIPNVLVSNGLEVTKTNAQGRWALPVHSDNEIFFVIKPSGYDTHTDELNLPRFYYLHSPNGSADDNFNYKGIAPTGPLPESIDFPLYRSANHSDTFTVALVADPQPYTEQEVSFYARDVIPEMASENIAFGIALGDLVGDYLDLLEPYNKMNSLAGFRWHNVIGNHDMNFMSPDDANSAETFKRIYGPTDYAFQQGKATFIILDNIIWNGFNGYRADGFPRTNNYVGGLTDNQLTFVRNLLQHVPTDNLVVLSTHIPLEGEAPHNTPQLPELMRAMSKHPRTLSLSGHTHVQQHMFFGSEQGYNPPNGAEHHHYNVGTASGTWWRGMPDQRGIPHAMMRDGTPSGWAKLHISGNTYTIRYKPSSFPDSYQMNVHAPDFALGGETFLVNVFNGSPKTTVEFRVGTSGDWTPMAHAPQIDPLYAKIVELDQTQVRGRGLNRGQISTHIWEGKLPANLPVGAHWLEVRATDMFGQVDTSRFPFRAVTADTMPETIWPTLPATPAAR